MALRNIVKEPDPILRKKCRTVENFDEKLWSLLDDMYDTMVESDGVGLAAPQVGILRRVAIVEIEDTYLELINPVIVKEEGEQIGIEGCLSIENFNCQVKRPMKIKIECQDRNGTEIEVEAEGYLAVACCHEVDHLNGILFKDKKCEVVE